MADAALGRCHRAQEGRVVVVVEQQAQPGAQVLDLSAVEEALAARDLVGDVGAAQRLLEGAGLVVGAVEDGELVPVGRLGVAQHAASDGLEARHRAFGLVLFVVAIDHLHRLAFAQVRPQRLREQLGVELDDVVGRAQDGAGGAVVLLQRDDLEVGVVLRQALEVVQRGAAPAVDGLVVVAHGGEDALGPQQQLEQLVLRGVGVLVLVDQHVAQLALPLLTHVLVVGQQLERQANEVVEVHRLVGQQALFVQLHHLGGEDFVIAAGVRQGVPAADAHVLPQADLPLPAAGELGIGRCPCVAQDAGDIVAVEDGELGLEGPGPRRLHAAGARPASGRCTPAACPRPWGR